MSTSRCFSYDKHKCNLTFFKWRVCKVLFQSSRMLLWFKIIKLGSLLCLQFNHSECTWSSFLILIPNQWESLVERPLFQRMKRGQQRSWPNEVEAHEWGRCHVNNLLIAHCPRGAGRELNTKRQRCLVKKKKKVSYIHYIFQLKQHDVTFFP